VKHSQQRPPVVILSDWAPMAYLARTYLRAEVPTPITQALEHFFEAAWHRTVVLNRKMIDVAHSNLKFSFELARAKTLSDVLSLQANYWQKQFKAFQAEDFYNVLSEAGEPRGPNAEPVRPQTKPKTVESPVLVDASQPKQKSAQKPLRTAAATDPQGERKSTKGRPRLTHGHPSSNEARARARKGRARRHDVISPSSRDKIQFGMLDENAVRFSSLEAWVLLDGAWRPISVDEVLSDAVLLSQARFDQRYPQVPQLPATAFQPKDEQNQ
jgi:hypothetical protein